MTVVPNPLKEPKPMDFELAKLLNDVEALEKENVLLEQANHTLDEQNSDHIEQLREDNEMFKKEFTETSEFDSIKVESAERLKERQVLDAKQELDLMKDKEEKLEKYLKELLKDNVHVDLSDNQKRGQVDFKLGDVKGLDRIRELETSIDEESVKVREAKEVEQTYEELQREVKEEAVYYEELIKRQKQDLAKTTKEFENFTQVCDQAVIATEQKQAEHEEIAEYCRQDRDARRSQLEEHRAAVKQQLEKTAQMDQQNDNFDIEMQKTQESLLESNQDNRQLGFIEELFIEKILSQHNFKSPTEFVNACKNQAVVKDDLLDQEEVNGRIKMLKKEVLETQQAISDCKYELQSADAMGSKIKQQLIDEIDRFENNNNFEEEMVNQQLDKIQAIKNALTATVVKLPLFKPLEETSKKHNLDQLVINGNEHVEKLLVDPNSFNRELETIQDVIEECEYIESASLLRLASFKELMLPENMQINEMLSSANDTQKLEEPGVDLQSAEKNAKESNSPAKSLLDSLKESQKVQTQQSPNPAKNDENQKEATAGVQDAAEGKSLPEYNDNLFINLDDDDEDLPIDDVELADSNVKIEFPKSRPSSKKIMRGKSGKAVIIGDVPEHLSEQLDRKAIKQRSLAIAEANKKGNANE